MKEDRKITICEDPKQQCESKISAGYYDEFIIQLIGNSLLIDEIMGIVMEETRGSENPRTVKNRIIKLRNEITNIQYTLV